MPLATLLFSAPDWIWAVLAATAVLVPLSWWALQPAAPGRRDLAVGLGLRLLGLGLLLIALLEPQWAAPRPKPGANVLAVLADNSQGLQMTDRGQPHSRGESLRAALAEPDWETLAAEYQIRHYTFGERLRRVTGPAALDFTEGSTGLVAALRDVRERFAQEPLAGVIVLTDGNATDWPANGLLADGLPPVYPIVIGDPVPPPDARLDRVTVRQTPFEDAPVALRVEVAGDGLDGRALNVAVRPLGAGADAPPTAPVQTIRAPGNGRAEALEFSWRPERAGLHFHEVTVSADASEPEATLINNRRLVLIDRGREEYRVLYVGGRMNWEFKFLNRAIAEDPQLHLVGLLRLALREPKFEFRGRAGEATNPLFRGFAGADDTTRYDEPVLTRLNTRDETELRAGFPREAGELFGYDAIILDDLEAGFFTPEQQLLLRRFVSERGGGLLMLGGVDTLEAGGYADTPLAAALPVHLDRAAARRSPQGELQWRLTREGWLEPWARVRATESEERDRLEAMPRLLIANALSSVKPGATVLATLEDETGETYPALVSQPFGHGRVAVVGAGDLWRWGLHGPDEQADLARFWRQLARWLVADAPARLELQAHPADAAGVELRLTARDPDFRPLDAAQVRFTIRRVDTTAAAASFEQVEMPADPDPETPGRYVARFRPREPGAYAATAHVADPRGVTVGTAETAWVHDPAAQEFAKLAPDRARLEELARQTGGAILELNQLRDLSQRLARATAPVMETHTTSLWHNGWVFALVLGCFAAEWGWRRWRGLP